MFASIVAIFLAVSLISGAPLETRGPTSVTIHNGTVVARTSGGVDSFKGIPYAQPPVGNLRLRDPLPLDSSFGTITSQLVPPSCPQFIFDTSSIPSTVLADIFDLPILQQALDISEDCLTIDVQRPSTITKPLPVLFWIYGGGFELGSTQLYDGADIVRQSIELGQPIVFVAVNYRVGGFGFLGGKEIKADGASNLGLKDQRLALKWVQDNIAAFGGDPTRVTIWGESAGAISVFDHTIINGGDHTYNGSPLFRGCIMNSGSILPAQDIDSDKAQKIYDQVVREAGCSDQTDSLACLRSVDYETIRAATNSVPGLLSYRAVDLSYLPRPDNSDNFFSRSPELSVLAGNFAKVPLIIGDQEDEGTLFSLFQSNITNTAQLVDYLASFFTQTQTSLVQSLVDLYPDNPSAGSPFNTGIFNQLYPQFKRLAALLGDASFTLTRRAYLSVVSDQVPSWTYLGSYFYGLPILGTTHVTDMLPLFITYDVPALPAFSIQTYYISFVNSLNPNSISTSFPLIKWPQWTTSSPQMMKFNLLNNQLIRDTFRNGPYEFIRSHLTDFRI